MFFWLKIMNFCPFVIKLILGGLWGWADLPATYRPISGRYRPNFEFWNFKNLDFWPFWSKIWHFGVQIEFFEPNYTKNIQNCFFRILQCLSFTLMYFWKVLGKIKVWNFGHFVSSILLFIWRMSQHGEYIILLPPFPIFLEKQHGVYRPNSQLCTSV